MKSWRGKYGYSEWISVILKVILSELRGSSGAESGLLGSNSYRFPGIVSDVSQCEVGTVDEPSPFTARLQPSLSC